MKPPIFVVGTMRSGSTLLRLLLDSHPNIAMGEETGFMGALTATKAIPNWRYGREWYGRLGWSEPELDARLRDFYAGMFSRYAASQGKSRWGDKTPLHSWHMAEMARVFPDAVFVAIVRHPGAVVGSLKKRFHWKVADAAAYWESTNVEVLRQGTQLSDARFALLRYEDLVLDPETTLRELTSWLGEPWSQDLLRHNDIQLAKGAPRLVDGSTSTREPITSQRVDRWQDSLDVAERRTVADVTSNLAGFLGYAADDAQSPTSIVPTRAAPPLLVTGDALARRQREHKQSVSFEARPQVLAVPEMDPAELARRLEQAESSLVRIRSRPVVRFSDAVRRAQRRIDVSGAARLLTSRRRLRKTTTGARGVESPQRPTETVGG